MSARDVVSEEATDERVFFLHVMKTGGTTVRHHIRNQFDDHQLYPSRTLDGDMHKANEWIDHLLSLPAERHARTRAYMGHFPHFVVSELHVPLVTLTVLRDPIERVVSHLRHLRRYSPAHRASGLESIYDDPILGPSLLRNHEVKVFALTRSDRPVSYRHVLEIDDGRLALAKSNLDAVDMVGVAEDLAGFLARVEARFGWRVDKSLMKRVSPSDVDVPQSLRLRIARDHEAALDFYAHARRRAEASC